MSNKKSIRTTNKNKPRNRFRIIAGQWRGRVLNFAEVDEIRPTADRIRETLFNWLQNEIVGASCLDVFTGSGALSFEALSRGAESVCSLELSAVACQTLKDNIELLQTNKMRLLKANSLDWLSTHSPQEAFDIVFLDPPFAAELLQTCCELLESKGWLSNQAYIYLEANSPIDKVTLPEGWILEKHKKAGQVYFGICRRNGL